MDHIPWEAMTRYLIDGILTESGRPGIMDFESPTLKMGRNCTCGYCSLAQVDRFSSSSCVIYGLVYLSWGNCCVFNGW